MFTQFRPTRVSSIYGQAFEAHFLENHPRYVKIDHKHKIYVKSHRSNAIYRSISLSALF